jgi:pilus assembly protein CpaE
MTQQAIIVSPDEGLVGILSRGLAVAGVCSQPSALGYYPEISELREMIDSSPGSGSVVLFDLAGQSRALDLIRHLRRSHPNVATLAVDQAPSRASFNGATEAGAWGYLAPPFDIVPLAEHFQLRSDQQERSLIANLLAPPPEAEPGRGQLLSFMPVQGGNGASTIALHVASAIARDPQTKALLLDFDFHSGTAAFRLRLKPRHTFVDLLESERLCQETWGCMVSVHQQLHILVAPASSTAMTAELMGRIPAVLASARRVYSCVIADLPDPLFTSSKHILKVSDRVYLVCTPEITSLHLARRKAQQLRDSGVPNDRIGLVVNRVGAWGSFQPSEVQRVVGAPVVWTLDNDYATLHEATLAGGLVAEDSGLGKQFLGLAEHIRATLTTSPVRA